MNKKYSEEVKKKWKLAKVFRIFISNATAIEAKIFLNTSSLKVVHQVASAHSLLFDLLFFVQNQWEVENSN